MSLAFGRRTAASVAVGLFAASCGRIGFDLLPQDSKQAVSNDASTGNGGARFDGAAGASSTGGTSGASSGGRSGSGGMTSSGGAGLGGTGGASGIAGSGGTTDASAPDGAGGSRAGGAPATGGAGGTSSGGASSGGTSSGGASSGGVSNTGGSGPVCASTSGTSQVWSFNSTVESWQYWPNAGPGTLSWTAATGNPTAGSLALDVTSGNGTLGWLVFDAPAPNLSGHTASVWLYLDSGTAGIKMYAQSNPSSYAWADGGYVVLTPKTWMCITINYSSPVYEDATFDPTNIVRIGVEIGGTGPLRIYADQFAY